MRSRSPGPCVRYRSLIIAKGQARHVHFRFFASSHECRTKNHTVKLQSQANTREWPEQLRGSSVALPVANPHLFANNIGDCSVGAFNLNDPDSLTKQTLSHGKAAIDRVMRIEPQFRLGCQLETE